MDSILNNLVEQVEDGVTTAKVAAAANAPLSDDESVAVMVHVEEAHFDAVSQYLNDNGGSVRFAEDEIPSRRMCLSHCSAISLNKRG